MSMAVEILTIVIVILNAVLTFLQNKKIDNNVSDSSSIITTLIENSGNVEEKTTETTK